MLIEDINNYLEYKRGAIHVGAHDGEERDFYRGFERTIWFEPNRDLYKRLLQNIGKVEYKNQTAYNLGVHDELDSAMLNVSSNDGQSSSILDLGLHAQYHPSVKYMNRMSINLVRLDSMFFETDSDDGIGYNINDFNFLNVDVQGVELNVIKSLGTLVSKLDYIYTEINDQELYVGCCLVTDIDAYLAQFGFKREVTLWTKNHWGDALYVKQNLL